jgi:hypothetical protein
MMKHFTLILLALGSLILSPNALGQTNPCPTVSSMNFQLVSVNGDGSCTKNFQVHLTNDVSTQPKGVLVEILSGGTVVVSNCFIASNAVGGANFTTDNFTVNCTANLGYRITRYTASNGNCQGGVCGEILLPIKLKNFTAIRNGSETFLRWATSTEQNNKGFSVERKTDGGWTEVAFVASQAGGGNSSTELSYQYVDKNNFKGVTEYRLKQIDFDGKQTFSNICIVKDTKAQGLVIAPNPVLHLLNVFFADNSPKDLVTLCDMSGKVVFQKQNVAKSISVWLDLEPGMYIFKATGESPVKVVFK